MRTARPDPGRRRAVRHNRATARKADGGEALAAAITRLFQAIDEEDEAVAAFRLQSLVDSLLDAAPATSPLLLERRLLGLARVLEERGPYGPDVIRLAIESGDRLH